MSMDTTDTEDVMPQPELETEVSPTEVTEDGTSVINNIDPSLSPGVKQ